MTKSHTGPRTVRLHMCISPDDQRAIDNWRFTNRIGTRAEAVRQLVYLAMGAATPQEPSEEDVERIALAICRCGRHETGQGTCSLICMDQLGDPRSKGCLHARRVHEAEARAALSAIWGRS